MEIQQWNTEAAMAGLGGLGKANEYEFLKYNKNYVQVNSRVVKPTPKYTDPFLGKHENIRLHFTSLYDVMLAQTASACTS